MPGILDVINNAADRSGLDADYLARIAKIESGMNPNARTGSYRGLFQLSPSEFARYGGQNIYDPNQNAQTAASMMADQRNAFTAKYGRAPSPTEAYMIHQQGAAGLDAHLSNPDAPAWQNMASTAEGRQKGEAWAKRAIWGNVPDDIKPFFGNVNNLSSADFINKVWAPKVEGDTAAAAAGLTASGSPPGLPVQADQLPQGAQAMGAQATPASGVSLFGGSPQNASQGTPGANPMLTAGMNMLGGGQDQSIKPMPWLPLPTAQPMQPLQRPQVDYSGLQALLQRRQA